MRWPHVDKEESTYWFIFANASISQCVSQLCLCYSVYPDIVKLRAMETTFLDTVIYQRRRIQLSQVRLDLIAFKHLPVVAFRRCPNLRDLLVLAKLPSNSTNPIPQLPCGSFRCGKNCATCPYISDGLTSYTFFSTGETRTIKSNLTCNTKNLIYMIQCNRCNLQYIGETKRRLKDRFNEHRRTIDNPKTSSLRLGGAWS